MEKHYPPREEKERVMKRSITSTRFWLAVWAVGWLLAAGAILAPAVAFAQNPVYGWTKSFGETSGGGMVFGMVVDSIGNIYTTGPFNGTANFAADFGGSDIKTSAGDYDIFVTRINANGTYGWTRRIGGTGYDSGYGVSADSSGNLYVAGRFNSAVNFAADFGSSEIKSSTGAGADVFITRINANGTYGWTKKIPGDLDKYGEVKVAVDSSGTVYVVGDFYFSKNFAADFGGSDVKAPDILGFNNIFITRINADGAYGWTKKLGEKGHAYGRDVSVDSSGNVYVAGYFMSNPASPALNFAADFGGSDVRASVGDYDICVTRINANGTYGWTRTMGGAGADYGYGVSVDAGGNVYTTGYFTGAVDFASGFGGSDLKTSAGDRDIFVSRISSGGAYGWTKRIGGGDFDIGRDISADSGGNVYVTGWFFGAVNFAEDFGENDSKMAFGSENAQGIFITRLNSNGVYRWTKIMGDGFYNDVAYGVSADSNGDVYLTGNYGGALNFAEDFGGNDLRTSTGGTIYLTKIINPPDTDNDGLPDAHEYLASCPEQANPDSDSDGLCDGIFTVPGICVSGEDRDTDGVVDAGESDPCNPDSDGDGLSDGDEVLIYHTNPLKPDTDGDGMSDGKEVAGGTNPLKKPSGNSSGVAGGCVLAPGGNGAGAGFWLALPFGLVLAWRMARRKDRGGR
jgi:hypothetical protein